MKSIRKIIGTTLALLLAVGTISTPVQAMGTTMFIFDYENSSNKEITEVKEENKKTEYLFEIGKSNYKKVVGDSIEVIETNTIVTFENEKVMLPLRFVADIANVEIKYSEDTRIITLQQGQLKAEVNTRENTFTDFEGNNLKPIETIKMIDGRTMVSFEDLQMLFIDLEFTNSNNIVSVKNK